MVSPGQQEVSKVGRRGPVARAGRLVRRAIVPEREMLVSEVGRLAGALERAREDRDGLREQVSELRGQIKVLSGRLDGAHKDAEELAGGLHEARRLNLRVAELTDLVTELVLPLHNRDIDIERLRPHTGDTL